MAAGASIVGSTDLIKDLLKGRVRIDDFDEIVVHNSMLVPLAPVRAILKHHFPTKTKGNYGADIVPLIEKFISGVNYSCVRNEFDPAFGVLELKFARLSMTDEQILENLDTGLAKIEETHKPVPGPKAEDFAGFIRKVYLKTDFSPPTDLLLIRHWLLEAMASRSYQDFLALLTQRSSQQEAKKSKKIQLLNVWEKKE